MKWQPYWKKIQNPFLEYRYKIPPFFRRPVDRIKRLAFEVLDDHKSKFGEDFVDNKKALNQISIIRSKSLKNKIAGYITKFIKKEIREEKVKQARIESSRSEKAMVDVPEPVDGVDAAPESVEEVTLTNDAAPESVEEVTLTNESDEQKTE
jgi:small subunit ribosomal protein S17e